MRKLIEGIAEFRTKTTADQKAHFAKLALGQSPDALFICCSDSRVAPNVFASTDPGDLFVIRNVGNIVPALDSYGLSTSDRSEAAAIEFAVQGLEVRDIILCGHSECGAMHQLLAGTEQVPWPNLKSWVETATPALKRWQSGEEVDPGLSEVNRLSQLNVLEQTSHLLTYPFVRERVESGRLAIHAWWFDIARAEVLAFDPQQNLYRPVDTWVSQTSLFD